jgi:hypothetical protein
MQDKDDKIEVRKYAKTLITHKTQMLLKCLSTCLQLSPLPQMIIQICLLKQLRCQGQGVTPIIRSNHSFFSAANIYFPKMFVVFGLFRITACTKRF